MEFNERLQELRKEKGLTQEELAGKLYVSRTAISKWESGRGYPSIDSLRLISKFFSVSLDELLSSNEVLTIAEDESRKRTKNLCDLVCGLLDVCMLLMMFLPFFASRLEEGIINSSLLTLEGVQPYVKITYFVLVISTAIFGVLTLALKDYQGRFWVKSKVKLSLFLGILSTLVFIVTLQANAATFAFALISVKALMLIFKGRE